MITHELQHTLDPNLLQVTFHLPAGQPELQALAAEQRGLQRMQDNGGQEDAVLRSLVRLHLSHMGNMWMRHFCASDRQRERV